MRVSRLVPLATAAVAAGLVLQAGLIASSGAGSLAAAHNRHSTDKQQILGQYKNLVVIFQENHSFDNLYGHWGKVGHDRVEGVSKATEAQKTQVDQNGQPYACLAQTDVNLTSPPLAASCTDATHTINGQPITSAFTNGPFMIDDYIKPTDTTCPAPDQSAPNGVKNGEGEPGGCTRDLVHRFYHEKYAINGGKQTAICPSQMQSG